MMDASLILAATTGPPFTATPPSRAGGADTGFAEILAQSAQQAAAADGLNALATQGPVADAAAPVAAQDSKKEDDAIACDAPPTNTAPVADLAALIAMVIGERLPAMLPDALPVSNVNMTPAPPAMLPASPGSQSGAMPAISGLPPATLPAGGDLPDGNAVIDPKMPRGEAVPAAPLMTAAPGSSVAQAVGAGSLPVAGLPAQIGNSPEGAAELVATREAMTAAPLNVESDSESDALRRQFASLARRDSAREASRDQGALPGAATYTPIPGTRVVSPAEFAVRSTQAMSDEAGQSSPDQPEAPLSVDLVSGPAATAAGSINAAQGGSAQITTSALPPATLLVPTHVESPAWSKDFGEHVIRLAVEGQPAAEIHLNPPNLGPIRVAIEMQGQEATLQFSAEHVLTREALENALPRLREMFSAGNLTLASADVLSQSGAELFSGSSGQRFDSPPSPHLPPSTRKAARSMVIGEVAPEAAAPRSSGRRSRVDLFA